MAPAGTGRRRRVALVGHACSSAHGSEPSFTWNWAVHLAKHHDVVVFCHPAYRSFIEKTGHPDFEIVWVEPKHPLDPWKQNGERGIRVHYAIWQRYVINEIRRVHNEHPFDLVHHVSWGSLNQPPMLWKLGIPFVWGPIGGGQTWPEQLLELTPSPRKEKLRSLAVKLSRWNPAIRKAMRHADLVLATNPETGQIARDMGARRVEMLLDAGTPQSAIDAVLPEPDASDAITFLWAGRLEPRKGLILALEAMAQLNEPGIRLVVAGEGPQREESMRAAEALQLGNRVKFLGQVPFQQMRSLFASAHAFVFTSVRDSVGSVLLEAMSARLPIITLDHQGAAFAVSRSAGVKIPVGSRQQIVTDLADGIRQLAADTELRKRLSQGAYDRAVANAWTGRASQMSKWYEEVLHAHRVV